MPDLTSTWSELSPATTQVLICDLQEQIVARSKTTSPEALSQSAVVLCQIADLFQIPLTLSVVPENQQAPKLIQQLGPFVTDRNQFPRATATPFSEFKTKDYLASQNRRTIVLAGFATEVVVLHAALDALRKGYGVVVAVDACGGMSDRTETAALQQIRDNGGIVTSVVSLATALSPDFTTEVGHRMFEIVQALRLA